MAYTEMRSGRHAVAELPQFIRDVEALKLSEEVRHAIINAVSADPLNGDEVRASGGVRKVRFAGRGQGKSGGYRVITAYFGPDIPVYLLAILSKGERSNFSAAEIAGFKKLTKEIFHYWRRRRAR
jgi:hypothetical protein